jgi:hypothetical protein
VSAKAFALFLTALTVTTGTRWPWSVIANGPVFDEKDHQKQCKYKYGGYQHENNFRHCPPLLNSAKIHFQTSFGLLRLLNLNFMNLRTANSILN